MFQNFGHFAARKRLKSAAGHGPRSLFSGLMRYESCGSSFVMKDKFSYQCSGYVNGKICDNRLGVRRELFQERLLARIKSDLLSDDSSSASNKSTQARGED